MIDTPHYHRVEDGLKYVAWRNNTFSLHVHVGDPRHRPRRARLRPDAPAAAAAARGLGELAVPRRAPRRACTRRARRPSRAASRAAACRTRSAAGARSATTSTLLIRTNSIIEFTQIWWSVRPHFSYGTVEVRICDVQPTAGESDALGALIVACVAQAALEVDAGERREPLPGLPDRGEHVARDPPRPRRQHDRLRARRRVPVERDRRAAARVDRAGARAARASSVEPAARRAQRRPAPARDDRGRARRCARRSRASCARRARPIPRRCEHERASTARAERGGAARRLGGAAAAADAGRRDRPGGRCR